MDSGILQRENCMKKIEIFYRICKHYIEPPFWGGGAGEMGVIKSPVCLPSGRSFVKLNRDCLE